MPPRTPGREGRVWLSAGLPSRVQVATQELTWTPSPKRPIGMVLRPHTLRGLQSPHPPPQLLTTGLGPSVSPTPSHHASPPPPRALQACSLFLSPTQLSALLIGHHSLGLLQPGCLKFPSGDKKNSGALSQSPVLLLRQHVHGPPATDRPTAVPLPSRLLLLCLAVSRSLQQGPFSVDPSGGAHSGLALPAYLLPEQR